MTITTLQIELEIPRAQDFHSIVEQETNLIFIAEQIESVAKEKFSRIAVPALRHWLKEFNAQPYTTSALKILALIAYGGLLGVGVINSYASLNLLWNGDYSEALTSNLEKRVDFANTITNAGALFACITDLPALTYVVYLYVLGKAHRKAMHEALDGSYQFGMENYVSRLTPMMHDRLYQRHILKLDALGIERFYVRPDLMSEEGKMHSELAPVLEQIDEQVEKEGISWRAMARHSCAEFKQASCLRKCAKLSAATLSVGCQALSVFLILENSLLIKDTPLSDLFSSDSKLQNNEAFYMSQLGGVFSSLIAFGASGYVNYALFWRSAYQKTLREKIKLCFANCNISSLSAPVISALYRVRELKLKRFSFY